MSWWFAHYLSCEQIKRSMTKGERISQFVAELTGGDVGPDEKDVVNHPFYRAFFRCWNEQRYYEAHDVLEQLWLKTKSRDANYFKGLIQAAGAFVHLQKRFEHPSHAKHGRRLPPASSQSRRSLLARFIPSMWQPIHELELFNRRSSIPPLLPKPLNLLSSSSGAFLVTRGSRTMLVNASTRR